MITYSIDIDALDAALEGLERLDAAAPQAQAQTVQRFGDRYLRRLEDATPVDKSALKAAYTTDRNGTSYGIQNKTKYLRFVTEGRRGFSARRGSALRFVIGGRVVFARRVKAAPANPFDARVHAAMLPEAEQASQELADQLIRRSGL